MAAECFVGCLGFLGVVPIVRAKQAWACVAGQLGKDYSISDMIGSGAYGSVYAGADLASGQSVAIKVISRSRSRVHEVEAEAALLQRIAHRNVVGFRKLLVGPRHLCLVMEHYRGGDLVEGLQRRMRQDSALIASEGLVHIAAQLASAVQHLHNFFIVHRDVKGDNVMMDREDMLDPGCRIALGDFGAARLLPVGERLTSPAGTKLFWAPEFFDGNYGAKVDIWALGVVVYSLMVCRFPFKDEAEVRRREPQYLKTMAPECRDFLRSAMRKTEAKRSSASELLALPFVRPFVEAAGAAKAGDATATTAATSREQSAEALLAEAFGEAVKGPSLTGSTKQSADGEDEEVDDVEEEMEAGSSSCGLRSARSTRCTPSLDSR